MSAVTLNIDNTNVSNLLTSCLRSYSPYPNVNSTPITWLTIQPLVVYIENIAADLNNLNNASFPPSGVAGGDLSGSYPNPTVSKIKGNTVPVNATGYLKNNGAGVLSWDNTVLSNALTNTHIFVGSVANIATDVAMSGDATISNTGALTLATVNANVGTFGDATHVPQITVNAKGLITSVSSIVITGVPPGGSASGDLAGTYPGPTVFQAHLTDQVAPTPPSAGTLILASFNQQGFSTAHLYDTQGNAIELLRDNMIIARNVTGSAMTKGQAVYISGSTGTVPQISLAKADSLSTIGEVGIVFETLGIANNGFGRVMILGNVENYNLSAFNNGDILYVSPTTAGGLTNVKPNSPNYPQEVGVVLNNGVGNGVLLVYTRGINIFGYNAGGDLTGTYPSPIVGANKITYAKIQQASAVTLLGNPTGIAANVQEITLGAGLSFSGTTLVNTGTSYSAGTGITLTGTVFSLTSPVTLTLGGTNASLTASNGGIVWSNATQLQILSGTATANQMLMSGATATPAWSTSTWPTTATTSDLLYATGTNAWGRLATANSSVLVTSGGGIPSWSAATNFLQSANNLSDVSNIGTSLNNLTLYQVWMSGGTQTTTSNTFVNVTNMVFTPPINTKWSFSGMIATQSSNTNGIKLTITVPTGCTIFATFIGLTSSGSIIGSAISASGSSSSTYNTTNNPSGYILINGTIEMSTNAGNWQLQMEAGTSATVGVNELGTFVKFQKLL